MKDEKISILVIEDDARMTELISRGLVEFGFDVTLAKDGFTGLKKAQEERFDLVLTDIILPGINGLEVCKRIKSADERYPVIMLTALGTTDDKVEGFDAGADDYMPIYGMWLKQPRRQWILFTIFPCGTKAIASLLQYETPW